MDMLTVFSTIFGKYSMINRLSNLINCNRSAAEISQVLCSSPYPHFINDIFNLVVCYMCKYHFDSTNYSWIIVVPRPAKNWAVKLTSTNKILPCSLIPHFMQSGLIEPGNNTDLCNQWEIHIPQRHLLLPCAGDGWLEETLQNMSKLYCEESCAYYIGKYPKSSES